MVAQFRKAAYDEQLLIGGSGIDFFVLQNPGITVRNKDGMKPGGQRRVDIGFWAVAEHPGRAHVATVLFRDVPIGLGVLLSDNLGGKEMFLHSRAFDFSALFFESAFRQKN